MSFQDRNVYVPTFRDDATYTTGNHTFQFGGVFKPIRQNPSLINDFNFVSLGIGGNTPNLNATLRPADIRAGSAALYDAAFTYALGRFSQISTNFVYDPQGNAAPPGSGRKRSYAYNEYEFYVQDNWRVRNNLTLNLGVRYHLYPAPYETKGFQAVNDVDFQTLVDTRINNAANGIAGNSAEPLLRFSLNGKANNGAPLYATDKNNFAPRIGFAYSPTFKSGFLQTLFGDRKSSIRGSGALVYDRPTGAITFIQDQSNYIFDSNNATRFGSVDPRLSLLNDPRFTSINSLPIQNVPPTITRPNTPFVTATGVPFGAVNNQSAYLVAKDFEIPYSYVYSLGIQRELPGNLLLDISYVGRLGRKLFTQADAAQVLNFRDTSSGQLMFDAFNAVQAQIEPQLAAGNSAPTVTAQPWLENQIRIANGIPLGTPCTAVVGISCTQLALNQNLDLFRVGGSADLAQQLQAQGLTRANVGISSQFATTSYINNLGSSTYNGLLVSLQKRLSQGFEFELNYTYSHSIDNQSSVVNTVQGGLLCDIRNLRACRADSDFDIRHLFNANYIWDLPFGRGRLIGGNSNRFVDAIIGGWTLSGIVAARSGLAISSASGAFPVSFVVNSPAILNGDKSAFKSNIREEGGGIQFFADPAAAQAALRFPRHGEIGSRNTFRSPAFVNFDMGLSKKFRAPWSETHMFTIRADGFNILNKNNFSTPNLTLNSTNFGRITGSLSNPREFQFAARYDF